MRLVFMGAPAFAAPTLAALVDGGHEIAVVYTRAPRPAGRRGLAETKTPVHALAESLGIEVRTPASLKAAEAQAEFAALGVDAAVVVAYGLILPKAILDAPRLGCFNLHASLLPRWRGAAPIQRAIMAGDAESGVMVMRMDEGLDTGAVASAAHIAIDDAATAGDVEAALAPRGAALMVEALRDLERGALAFAPQPTEGATYAAKIAKDEARIDWTPEARSVLRHVHGLSPFPGAWFAHDFGVGPERVKVLRCALAEGIGEPGIALDDALRIACGAGAVRLLEVQRAGKAAMRADDFLRGARLVTGSSLR